MRLRAGFGRRGEDRLHHRARRINEALQRAPIGFDVRERPRGDAAVDRRLRHRRRDRQDQARVERTRDEEVRPEAQILRAVGRADHVRLLGLRQFGDRPHGGELHLLVDRGRADVERAAEDEREAEDVVDLVRIVRAAGRDDRVGPDLLGEFRAGSPAPGWRAPGSTGGSPSPSTISGLSTPPIETPRKMSAPSTASARVRAEVSRA